MVINNELTVTIKWRQRSYSLT